MEMTISSANSPVEGSKPYLRLGSDLQMLIEPRVGKGLASPRVSYQTVSSKNKIWNPFNNKANISEIMEILEEDQLPRTCMQYPIVDKGSKNPLLENTLSFGNFLCNRDESYPHLLTDMISNGKEIPYTRGNINIVGESKLAFSKEVGIHANMGCEFRHKINLYTHLMAESQKGTSSTGDSKKKSSLLDEEIGKEFLSSWKSMSVTEDDAIDFNCESVPKGRKKPFNFDKLDMDFALDGDFDKLSSFKVDMSDLDFSSPPRKIGKPKERSEEESIHKKHQGKQDRFSFSFDFNELESFDFDSSLKKGEKTSDKCADDKGFDSSVKQGKIQVSRTNIAVSVDAFEDSDAKKSPASKSLTTSKFESLIGDLGDHEPVVDHAPSTSTNFKNLNASQDATTSPEREITTRAQETDQCSEQSVRTGSVEPSPQHILQDLSVHSVPSDEIVREMVPELLAEVCSLDTEVNNNPGGEQNVIVKTITDFESNHVKLNNMKHSSPGCITGSQRSEFRKETENQYHIPVGVTIGNESAKGDIGIEDASVTSVSQKMPHSTKSTIENKNSIVKPLLSPLDSETRIDKLDRMKEEGKGGIKSKFFSRSEETESQLHLTSSPKKISSVSDKRSRIVRLSPADERRQDFNASDVQTENQNVGSSKLHDRAVSKVAPVILGSQKNDIYHNTSSFQVHPASLPEQSTKSATPKCINPKLVVLSMAPNRNSIISVEKNKISPLKAGKKTSDMSSLKALRTTTLNNLSNSSFRKERKSLRYSEENMEVQVNTAPKIAPPVSTGKKTLFSASLKRKTFEASNANPESFYPLKRLAESPTGSRKAREASQRVDEGRVCNTENLVESHAKDVFFDHPTSTLDVPREAHLTELEVPIVMDNDGNVEKAEACTKELENICNMLKKKHEEAKEILVRAIVNNNNLLMLNHPIYEEKISFPSSVIFF
ncbi:hypothetical protein HHK36_005078 [Tetracentron sinense]|uniref:Uncharacterized protein n=1 Tax=Tetracentron sinense TaxID=13715 RepID=A0A835DQT1_TETSI|nr:hypothetical protein HHK36_005078 [Tetracentron sinense]